MWNKLKNKWLNRRTLLKDNWKFKNKQQKATYHISKKELLIYSRMSIDKITKIFKISNPTLMYSNKNFRMSQMS